MTDQLEHDLRTLLTERAAAVTADQAGGEIAIAERLRAGDQGLAGAVAGDGSSSSRRPWVIGALAAAAAVIVAVLVLREDDQTVRSGPAATDTTEPVAPASVLEFRPVLASGPCDELGASATRGADDGLCYDLGDPLPGNELVLAAGVYESFSSTGTEIGGGESTTSTSTTTAATELGVQLQLTDEGIERLGALAAQCAEADPICPTAQLAIVIDGIVFSAPTVDATTFEGGEVTIAGDFTEAEATALAAALSPHAGPVATATTTAPPTDDPTVGTSELDGAKDVAERVALTVFGEEYITMAADDDGDSTLVTLEGPGGTVVAVVTFDHQIGRQRLVGMSSPALDRDGGLGTLEGGVLILDLPVGGTLTVTGLDEQLQVVGSTLSMPVTAGELHITDVEPWLGDATWQWINLVTHDDEVLQAFGAP